MAIVSGSEKGASPEYISLQYYQNIHGNNELDFSCRIINNIADTNLDITSLLAVHLNP